MGELSLRLLVIGLRQQINSTWPIRELSGPKTQSIRHQQSRIDQPLALCPLSLFPLFPLHSPINAAPSRCPHGRINHVSILISTLLWSPALPASLFSTMTLFPAQPPFTAFSIFFSVPPVCGARSSKTKRLQQPNDAAHFSAQHSFFFSSPLRFLSSPLMLYLTSMAD